MIASRMLGWPSTREKAKASMCPVKLCHTPCIVFIGMDGLDDSVLEAVSWALASELMRRHPVGTRFIRGHPAGGQSDVLWILDATGGSGDIRLNRSGRIHVLGRFDGGDNVDWEPTEWVEYLAEDQRVFIERIEAAAGLPVPSRARPATPTTLTYRLLAAIAVSAMHSGRSVEIQEGYIDTSGYGGGPNEALGAFPISDELLRVRDDDFWQQAGYRFWIVMRDEWPILAAEQTGGVVWLYGGEHQIDLVDLYRKSHRNIRSTAAKLLKQVDHL